MRKSDISRVGVRTLTDFRVRTHRGASLTGWLKKYSTAKPTRTEAQKDDRFRRGRQIAHMIYGYFRVTGTDEFILDISDLNATLRGDDEMEFSYRSKKLLMITFQKVCTT